MFWLIIGSDRRSETKQGKIDRCRSCLRHLQRSVTIAVANLSPPTDRIGCINLLPKCKLYLGVCSPLIPFRIPFKGRFLCRLGLRVGFLYRLGFSAKGYDGQCCHLANDYESPI